MAPETIFEKNLVLSGREYRLLKKIGSGAYGEVYEATDEKGGSYAVKVLTIQPDPSQIESFKSEFLLLTQLRHPSLCQAQDFAYSESVGHYLFVSELASGLPFFEATEGANPEDVERLAVKVLAVLDYLHLHDVIHFDIKCPNILVSPSGEVKLLDFGLAHLARLPLKKFPGSLRYAAPELLIRSLSTDHRADLYSFGMVLFRALTRHFPFNENDPVEMMDWHLHQPLVWKGEEAEQIPTHLRKLVQFLLNKIPAERLSRAQSAINWINLHSDNRYQIESDHSRRLMPHEGRLITRDRELDLARSTLSQPSGGTLILSGERGIGKSRLLREIKYMAEVKELACLWFHNFLENDALTQLSRQLDLPPFHSPDEFFNISLQRLESKAPLALFVDDLHEADPFLWEWLGRLHERRLPVYLFLSWEGVSPNQGPLLPLFQSEKVLPLAPLTPEDLKIYLTEILGDSEASKKWLDPLFEFSTGIPLLVSEGLRYLMESPAGTDLPESIQTLYEKELVALSPEAIRLLETISLRKRSVTLDELARSMGTGTSAITPLIPPLLSKGLISRIAQFDRPGILYRIANAALAVVLKSRQDPQTKCDRLLKILGQIEPDPESSPEELAALSLETGIPDKVRPHLFRLAESYESSFQTRKAIETYRQLLPFAKKDPETNQRVRKRLIPLLVLAGQPDDALSLFPKDENLTLPDRKLLGWVLTRIGRFQDAADLYRRGIAESDESNPLHGELINHLANVYVQTGEADKAVPLFEKTIPPPGIEEAEKFRLLKNNNLGLALSLTGKIAEARAFESEKLDFFRKVGDEHHIAATLSHLGFIELKGQEMSKATSWFQESLNLSEKIGDLHNILIVLDNLVSIFQRRGLYHEALHYYAKGVDYRSTVSPPYQIAQNYLKGAFLYLTMGLTEPAKTCLERLETVVREAPSLAIIGWIQLAWGYYHRAVGLLEDAIQRLKKAVRLAEQKNEPRLLAWGHYALADLLLEQKRFPEAAATYQKGVPLAEKVSDDELRLRMRLLFLLLVRSGELKLESNPEGELEKLTRECETLGLLEVAAEGYAHLSDPKARDIYLEIASHLPEEYKLAYLGERFRQRILAS